MRAHVRFGYHAPGYEGREVGRVSAAGGSSRVEPRFIDIDTAPEVLLRRLSKDARLIAYGGANFGMPLELLEPAHGRVVPNDIFFVRSNGPVPVVELESWRLSVTGAVERPLSLSIDDLRRLGSSQIEAFLECAGNGRTRFEPLPPGTPWRNDAVGNALWEGVPLERVLEAAGVKPGSVDVVTQGADFQEMRRGLPLAVARNPEVLVVWGMNGKPLPVAHGGPVRLLVPGWAGIASTKWLTGIEVLDRAFDGFWNTDNYVIWDERGDPLRPVAEMPPKSVIVTPGDGKKIPAGPVRVAGWAWSGYGSIESIDVSTDAGRSWHVADLLPGVRRGWRRWQLGWDATPGQHHLRVRATDERRLSQPVVAPWNAKGYVMNAIQEIVVEVET